MSFQPSTLLRVHQTILHAKNQLTFGFSGAGFLGCYHVGVAACLHRHGLLPNVSDCHQISSRPIRVTGVSAGSMIAAAVLAGVNPDPDGMEVVLEAARRTRKIARFSEQKQKATGISLDFNFSLDVLTPGFSLIDQVEEPFREAIVKALGGTISKDQKSNTENYFEKNCYDIDPELFQRRFPQGALRIGLTDRRALWPPPITTPLSSGRILEAYRFVDSYRDVDDILSSCLLSSYIPGVTGPFYLRDKVPEFLSVFFGLLNKEVISEKSFIDEDVVSDTTGRAGRRLKSMESIGLVKHGKTGLPTVKQCQKSVSSLEVVEESHSPTDFWDGGIADVFPTFDDNTIIVAPLNGVFDPNPAICPMFPSIEDEVEILTASLLDESSESTRKHLDKNNPLNFQTLLRSYLPTTFKHCNKARLGLNLKNAQAAMKMLFSSEEEELYQIYKQGYDDTKRFLNHRGLQRVFHC